MKQTSCWARLRSALLAATFLALLAVALSARQAQAGRATQATPINSDIVGDTTWSIAGSPYQVTAPIRITNTATLTIEAGVEITFAAGAGLRVEGGLNAQGTQARQVRMVGDNGAIWQGLTAAQPTRNLALQSVTIQNALAGLAIRQQTTPIVATSGRVDVLNSLLLNNRIGIDADYSVLANAPRLIMRNNLLTNNQIGLQLNGLPSGNIKSKFNHNSFVGNGIGVNAINISGNGVEMQQQWWGSPDGPLADP
ncbi:MAG TPA: hypothetical protein VKE41_18400, partial [Roseiflexaceae bacterium]|nr:hypothetical protein [Roseiflexaceae bacterium]